MTPPDTVAVLPLGGPGAPPVARCLEDAADWFAALSYGRWRPHPIPLSPLTLDRPLAAFTISGSLAARGPSSRDLVRLALDALPGRDRSTLAGCRGRLMIVAADARFRPHVWAPDRGGVSLGQGAWCQRYAVVPAEAPLGAVVHELAHLLLGWPDGRVAGPGARYCLMALGGLRAGGTAPTPPAAPLLLDLGWRRALRLDSAIAVGALGDAVGTIDWAGHRVVAELRGDRLLAWTGTCRPDLVANVDLAREQPALAAIAPALRRLRCAARPIDNLLEDNT